VYEDVNVTELARDPVQRRISLLSVIKFHVR